MFTSFYIVLVKNTLLVFSRICSGGWVGAYVEPQHPLDLILDLLGIHLLDAGPVTINIGDFVLGFLAAGITLSILAYPLVWGVSMFLPNRGKALEDSETSN